MDRGNASVPAGRTKSTRIRSTAAPPTPEPPSFLRRNARLFLGLAFAALLVHDVFGTHGLVALMKTRQEITRLRGEVAQLDKQNQDLSGQVHALKTDPRLIERIAREEMGLQRPKEKVFKLPQPNPNAK
jgi:cell division protein FtsB